MAAAVLSNLSSHTLAIFIYHSLTSVILLFIIKNCVMVAVCVRGTQQNLIVNKHVMTTSC